MAGGLSGAESHPAAATALASSATVFGLATEQWLTIAAGLAIGVVARWALLLTSSRDLGWRTVRIDAMMFAANGVLAAQAADAAGLSGIRLLTAAMMFGAASTMLFSRLLERWIAKAEAPLMHEPTLPPDTMAEAKPANGREVRVLVEAVAPDSTPTRMTGRNLRRAFQGSVKQPLTETERVLVERIDEADRDDGGDGTSGE